MATSTTVTRTRDARPWVLGGTIAAVSIAIGLVGGVVLGVNLAATVAGPPTTASVELAQPVSAPGNPYANIHIAAKPATQPVSAPGNPYANIYVP